MPEHTVDCIVRFHDVRRLSELNRCVFSLVGQSHRPVNVILALQRFSPDALVATHQALQPLLELPEAPTLTVCNFNEPTPVDARGALLNMGLRAARGRYIGFLDYDDVLYPEAYTLLTRQIEASDAAIAFAAVRVVMADVYPQFLRVDHEVENRFGPGDRLRDLFDANFCPIHSFLIDRHKISAQDLIFDPTLKWEEDYDFLLRLCARYHSNFKLISTKIGDYYYKRDGSNSIPVTGLKSPLEIEAYGKVRLIIESRRRTTLVSAKVQAEQGLSTYRSGMTIRDFMNAVPGRAG
jgi:hypothetical protein